MILIIDVIYTILIIFGVLLVYNGAFGDLEPHPLYKPSIQNFKIIIGMVIMLYSLDQLVLF